MKTFQQFLEEVSRGRRVTSANVIKLGSEEQANLNKAKWGQDLDQFHTLHLE